MDLHVTINGQGYELQTEPNRRLIDILREDMGLTGTKEGCGEGECGACTILLDGKAVHACLVVAAQLENREVLTIEGLLKNGRLHPLQQAFIQEGAIQCGYCTAGMIMTALGLLLDNPHPTEDEIRRAIAGNICRCSSYREIICAIQKGAEEMEKMG